MNGIPVDTQIWTWWDDDHRDIPIPKPRNWFCLTGDWPGFGFGVNIIMLGGFEKPGQFI